MKYGYNVKALFINDEFQTKKYPTLLICIIS